MVEKLQKTWKDFVGKGFFGVWRLLNGTKRRYLHGFVRLPGTKPCKLRWSWAVYASKWPQNTINASVFMFSAPPIFKSGLKPRYLQVFLWRKGLLRCLEASKWHKVTVLTWASAPSCHKTLYIGMVSSYVRFQVATKHRKYH